MEDTNKPKKRKQKKEMEYKTSHKEVLSYVLEHGYIPGEYKDGKVTKGGYNILGKSRNNQSSKKHNEAIQKYIEDKILRWDDVKKGFVFEREYSFFKDKFVKYIMRDHRDFFFEVIHKKQYTEAIGMFMCYLVEILDDIPLTKKINKEYKSARQKSKIKKELRKGAIRIKERIRAIEI